MRDSCVGWFPLMWFPLNMILLLNLDDLALKSRDAALPRRDPLWTASSGRCVAKSGVPVGMVLGQLCSRV